MADPDIQILRGWRGGHPDPEIRGGGRLWSENKPGAGPSPGSATRREIPRTVLEKLNMIFLTLRNLL